MIDINNNQQPQDFTSQTTPDSASSEAAKSSSPISTNAKNKMKKPSIKMIAGIIVLVLTIVGGIAGYLLTQTSQDVRQQAAEETYGQVCCTFNGGQTYSYADAGICQGNGTQVADTAETCSADTGSGTQACPNGQTHLNRVCINDDTATQTCINGKYSVVNCSEGYTCFQGNCLEDSAERSCAGDVPDGATACQGINTQVTCNDGQYVNPITCSSSQKCTQGRCQTIVGDPGDANCNPAITNTSDPDYCGIFGTGECASNSWNVYECDSTSTSGGCHDKIIGTTNNTGVNGYLASTPSCSTRQADCIGGGLEFRSRVNNSGSCQSAPLPGCYQACTTATGCASSNHSCIDSLCRLPSNPDSSTCSPPIGGPSTLPGSSPTPSPSSKTYSCNSTCSTDAQCQTIGNNYECNEAAGNRCRLKNNPNSAQCNPPTQNYFCNSNCSTDAQCQTANNNFVCSEEQGNKCRLANNLTSAECQPLVGPMCLSLSLTNVSNPNAGATDDPKLGDAVSFTCGLVNGADHYIFRVIEPDQTIVDLNATGATSTQYTITKDGAHAAQCQICTGADASTCHAYEDPFN